jgi:hypothetical protein
MKKTTRGVGLHSKDDCNWPHCHSGIACFWLNGIGYCFTHYHSVCHLRYALAMGTYGVASPAPENRFTRRELVR